MLPILLLACAEPPPPSILWITMDGARADAVLTPEALAGLPNLAALAARGHVYDMAFAHSPDAATSARTMMTAMPPEVVGDATGAAWSGPTLASHLGAHGYRAAAFVGLPSLAGTQSDVGRGFDPYDDSGADTAWPATRVVARARAWMDGAEGPTFVWAAFADVGAPYTPTAPPPAPTAAEADVDGSAAGLDAYRSGALPLAPVVRDRLRALYTAELREVDTAIGGLLEAAAPDTIVVVTAAHGESFAPSWPYRHEGCTSDEVLHVPLLIATAGSTDGKRSSGGTAGPERSDRLVALVDAAPTVLALAKLPPFERSAGRDIGSGEPRTMVWARTPPGDAPVCGTRPGPLVSVRTPTHRVIWSDDNIADAYHLTTDPEADHPIGVPPELSEARAVLAGELATLR